ncbi:T. brucei spp.-specific protein [Trypanosoma brucei gambiense DAL972]|uniref:T. brucei spp.-specific protein n=1 Tax=Trypanosoma brucei gambiense (strain MHOM/CI/86/DAL972) TaxID=679716 RepID=C9ZT92_TRYB9|nr:T. brucei spp.-specific protein [Trypanosoma brucei gambiense DAL972]CBH12627.1 T. brucei spp.-specific protein [Trypanosoma brucei gambiense DAL972]|eukprot:XP_011774907.1 T. brucei spp.-specific protein [Trypanosoma brucei gambiense DAL972]
MTVRGACQCSWGTPAPPLLVFDSVEAAQAGATAAAASASTGGTEGTCNENNANSADTRGSGQVVALTDGKAPWVELREQRRLTHIAIVSNARVVELHTDGSEVQTHEGASAVASGGVAVTAVVGGLSRDARYFHFIDCCVAPGERVQLKFFARKPKDAIHIVAICVSGVEETPLPELTPTGGYSDNSNYGAATSGQTAALETRLQELEMMVRMMVGTVMRRLNDVEARVAALEERANE